MWEFKMIYRIINKTTKEFLRDDFTFNPDTEIAFAIEPPRGMYKPILDIDTKTWSEGSTDEELATIATNKATALEKATAITYLSNTNYVAINYNNLLKVNEDMAEKYYNGVSDTYGVTVEEILKRRASYIAYLNEF